MPDIAQYTRRLRKLADITPAPPPPTPVFTGANLERANRRLRRLTPPPSRPATRRTDLTRLPRAEAPRFFGADAARVEGRKRKIVDKVVRRRATGVVFSGACVKNYTNRMMRLAERA